MSVQTTPLHNLPIPSTVFVGRQQEVSRVVERLQSNNCRLLTLVGSGGVGKTRLAIEVVQHLSQPDFPNGVFYVPLAPLNTEDNIIPTIINILSIRVGGNNTPREALLEFLSQRNLLLVFDNFEHLLNGATLVADILTHAPDVTILTTSRKSLGLRAEHLWEMRGLRYPDNSDPEDINQFDALNLFIECTLQIRHNFSVSSNQHKIIEICQLVDGLPLAIELAAGWLRSLSCDEIIKQIKHGLDILSTSASDIPERHRSIRAVFDHSWHLLTPDEQAVFPRLSVFRGGFTWDSSKQVANASINTLSGLVEKSMIRRLSDGRYDIHELMRQYAYDKLTDLEQVEATNNQHLNYFAQFMVLAVPDLQGKRQVDRLVEIKAEFDNILSAWEHATQRLMIDKLDMMLEGLQIYFELNRQPPVSTEMYQLALSQLDETLPQHRQFHIRLLIYYWYVVFRQRGNQFANGLPGKLEEYTRYVHDAGDKLSLLMCEMVANLTPPQAFKKQPDLDTLVTIGRQLGDYYLGWVYDQICYYYTILLNENSPTTLDYLHEFLRIAKSINDVNGIATAYSHLAQHMRFWGNIDDAIDYYNHALDGFRQTNNVQAIAIFRNLKIFMGLKKGRFTYVIAEMPQGMNELTNFGFFANHRYMHMTLAKAEILSGNLERGRQLLSKIQTLPYDHRPRTIFHTHEAIAMRAIAINDINTLRQELTRALEGNIDVIAVRLLLDFLILTVFLYHHDQQPDKSIEIVSLVFNHPLSTTEWMMKWDLLTRLINNLENDCDTRLFEQSWQRGKQLDLYVAIDNLRHYLNPSVAQPVQHLIEPLTDRELDVLVLLGEGNTNEEIAQKLTVAIGTVKAHTNKIYRKLNVTNRTKAILKAKQLRLIPQ